MEENLIAGQRYWLDPTVSAEYVKTEGSTDFFKNLQPANDHGYHSGPGDLYAFHGSPKDGYEKA